VRFCVSRDIDGNTAKGVVTSVDGDLFHGL